MRAESRAVRSVLAFLIVLIPACSGRSGSDADAASKADAQRSRWETANIHDYTWHVYVGCFCDAGTTRVKVVRDKPVDAREGGKSLSIEKDELFGIIPLTIDQLFDRLDEARATGTDVVDVTYDPTYGFPSDLRIDPRKDTSDDELEFVVKSFEPAT